MICNCTLAGTDACKNCSNNYDSTEYNLNNQKIMIIKKEYVNIGHKEGHPVLQYWCSECAALLNKYARYCHNCGSKINWDNAEEE